MKYFCLFSNILKISAISTILCSFSVFAFPAEGDYVRFLAKYKGKVFEYKKNIIDFHLDTNSFVVIEKITNEDDEVIQERTSQLPYYWFYTEKKIQNTLDNCTRREGALGDWNLQGKMIPSCTFFSEDSQMDYTIGMVPFGQLRFQYYLGRDEFLDFYLQDYY